MQNLRRPLKPTVEIVQDIIERFRTVAPGYGDKLALQLSDPRDDHLNMVLAIALMGETLTHGVATHSGSPEPQKLDERFKQVENLQKILNMRIMEAFLSQPMEVKRLIHSLIKQFSPTHDYNDNQKIIQHFSNEVTQNIVLPIHERSTILEAVDVIGTNVTSAIEAINEVSNNDLPKTVSEDLIQGYLDSIALGETVEAKIPLPYLSSKSKVPIFLELSTKLEKINVSNPNLGEQYYHTPVGALKFYQDSPWETIERIEPPFQKRLTTLRNLQMVIHQYHHWALNYGLYLSDKLGVTNGDYVFFSLRDLSQRLTNDVTDVKDLSDIMGEFYRNVTNLLIKRDDSLPIMWQWELCREHSDTSPVDALGERSLSLP